MTAPASAPSSGSPADSPAPARWGLVLTALVAFVTLPMLPTGIRSMVPIAETLVMVTAALAICAMIGWWRGGNPILALVWIVVAGWMLYTLGTAESAYGELARGWTLLVIAAFGIASLLTPAQGFFHRALVAVGIAAVASFLLILGTPNGVNGVQRTMVSELERRTGVTIALFEEMTRSPEWKEAARRSPNVEAMIADNEAQLRKLPEQMGGVLPALLALESIAALGLGWSLLQRLSRNGAGPSIGRLRDFRFNDQLIWGLAVGVTLYFLPAFADGRGAGLNLLVFFGTLYLFRGIGVLSWGTRGRGVGIGLILLTAFVPFVVGALAFGVGVGDTWMDWRKRMSAKA